MEHPDLDLLDHEAFELLNLRHDVYGALSLGQVCAFCPYSLRVGRLTQARGVLFLFGVIAVPREMSFLSVAESLPSRLMASQPCLVDGVSSGFIPEAAPQLTDILTRS